MLQIISISLFLIGYYIVSSNKEDSPKGHLIALLMFAASYFLFALEIYSDGKKAGEVVGAYNQFHHKYEVVPTLNEDTLLADSIIRID